MKNNCLTACLALMIAAFFGYAAAQQTNETITIGTVQRSYIKYLPAGLNASEDVSLIFVLHGLGDNNANMASAGFNYLADTARVIVIYPQGLTNNWGQTSWNNGTLLSSAADDIGFIGSVMDEMMNDYNVNPSRVYCTGFSMGSIMSYHLACTMNDRLAAIGCMSGTMSTSDIQSCEPAYATPVIHLHGTADGTVPYNSNPLPSLSLVPETVAFWQDVHGCDTSADSTRAANTANDGITCDRFVYDNCTPDGSLELWRLNGADHVYLYQPVNDITEMFVVWRFLRKWQHPSPAAAGLNEQTIGKLSVAPNPSNGLFSVTAKAGGSCTITSLNGKEIGRLQLEPGVNDLDLANQPSGVYFLRSDGSVYKLVKN
jgi:polyhydroxybutyrate depolymerase